MSLEELSAEIARYMPPDEFLRIHQRLAQLRKEEEDQLKALAELQNAYLAANTDQQRERVKLAVGQIREISRKTRVEIRSLNTILHESMGLAMAKELYEKYLQEKRRKESE